MFKTNALDSVANAYVDENIPSVIPGTRLEADDRNIIQDELTNAVEESGQTLDTSGVFTNNDQLSKAIQISSIGHIDGFILSNGTDTDHDIDISDGACSFKDGTGNFRSFQGLTVPTKQIDVNWAEGDNDGGFPSGLTLAANTIYDFFLIGKDDGTIDAGFDVEGSDAANLLSDATGYTWSRRILSVKTDVSLNIIPFKQYDDLVMYKTPITDINDATIVEGVWESGLLSVPVSQIAKFSIEAQSAAGETDALASLANSDLVDSILTMIGFKGDTTTVPQINHIIDYPVDASSTIRYQMTDGGAGTIIISSMGWTDNRGRNQ